MSLAEQLTERMESRRGEKAKAYRVLIRKHHEGKPLSQGDVDRLLGAKDALGLSDEDVEGHLGLLAEHDRTTARIEERDGELAETGKKIEAVKTALASIADVLTRGAELRTELDALDKLAQKHDRQIRADGQALSVMERTNQVVFANDGEESK